MKTHRIPVDQLAHLPARALFTPSLDRHQVAYYSNHTGRFELYALNLSNREAIQLTDGQAPRAVRAGLVFSPDNSRIYYAKDENGNEHNDLLEVDLQSATVTNLYRDPNTQEYVVDVFPDNRSLLTTSNRDGQTNLYRFDRIDKTWHPLTNFTNPVGWGRLSRDGSTIAFNANQSQDLRNVDGYLMNADGSHVRQIFRVSEGTQDEILDWHPTGESLLISSDATGVSRVGAFNLITQTTVWLGVDGMDIADGEFSQNGHWVLLLENQSSEVRPVLYTYPDGTRRDLKLPPGVASQARFVLDDTHLMIYYASATRRGELLLYNLADDSVRVLLPAEYGSIDPQVFVGNRHVNYPSSDGSTVPAILYVPDDIPPGSKLAAVIDVHGGPTAQYFRSFNSLAQLLVDQGYVVLQPNFRGSTGYGRTWREGNHMDWGGGDLDDVAAGVSYLSTLGYVDMDRIAIFGGSYGGYMSYMAAVKKPDLFKVAIPWVGITDLLLLYEEDMSHFQYYLRSMLGDPVVNRALWQERSAINYVDAIKAHLCIVHGVNDPRCPIAQARNFRDRLLHHGFEENRDFDYIELEEGHGAGGDPAGTERMFTMLISFLTRNL